MKLLACVTYADRDTCRTLMTFGELSRAIALLMLRLTRAHITRHLPNS